MGEIHLPHCHCDNENKIIKCMPSVEDCSSMADIFKQLSDGTRLRILWMLCHLEECVSNIAAAMEMSDPAVSHHLKQRPDREPQRGQGGILQAGRHGDSQTCTQGV